MANTGPANQRLPVFLTYGPTPHLDGKHTVFGRVTAGMDVRSIRERDPGATGLRATESTRSRSRKARPPS